MQNVADKVAFITGGASGIGLGIVKAFAWAGMKVIFTYRREAPLKETMEYFAGFPQLSVHPLRVDVTDRHAMSNAAQSAAALCGNVHVLCTSAGVNLLGAMDCATYDDWDWIMGVNVGGVINTLVSFLPGMKAHGEGGHVINVASMSSFISGPGAGVYAASKFAVRGLTESLRYSLAPHGIGVSLVCPGLTKSRIYEAPLHRPENLSRTAFPLEHATLSRLSGIHALGMDPDEVGRKTLDALLHNRFYVFSHPEFREELRESCDEIVAAFTDETPDSRRLAFEERRRSAKAEAAAAFARLK